LLIFDLGIPSLRRRVRAAFGMQRLAILIALLLFAASAHAEFPTTQPFEEVTFRADQRHDPDERMYVLTVDLTDPDVSISVATAGPDPDGEGPWQTTLRPVREIAEREGFDIAINASYFEIVRGSTTRPIPEEAAERSGAPATQPLQQGGYVYDIWASNVGWTMIDGKLLTPRRNLDWPIVAFGNDGKVAMGNVEQLPAGAKHIITGNGMVLEDGHPPASFKSNLVARHPRTVLGIDKTGTKLTILTLDGRRPGVSVGMTGAELAKEMQRLGCWDAINLDGGGSTTLLIRDPQTRQLHLINHPSDGNQRAVSDAIGIKINHR
jgi:exopolysaccharide biosynthesis protein